MRVRRSRVAGGLVLLSGLLVADLVAAQGAPAPGPPAAGAKRDEPFLFSHDRTWVQVAAAGQARQKQGDCKGAIDAYDEALRSSIDPKVHRDRGLCHEALNHPYPAVEDYRVYLTAHPDATDSDDIRQRLQRLEQALGIGGPSSDGARSTQPAGTTGSASGTAGASGGGGSASGQGSVSLSVGGSGGGSASADGASTATLDRVQQVENEESEMEVSPLRRGRGFILGPYLDVRRFDKSAMGWGQAYGLTMRYSFSSLSTVLVELGGSAVNATGTPTELGGVSTFLGYEARFGLDRRLTNGIYVGAGCGYEHLKQGAAGLVFATVLPRGRLGYRHVWGPSLGLEVGLDGGAAILNLLDPPPGASSSNTSAFLGLHVALALGF